MADNIVISSGQTTATDDVGGVHVPRVKVQVGADGAAVDVRPPADSMPTDALVASGGLVYDRASAAWKLASSASRDGETVANVAASAPLLFNGATADRQRGNTEGTLLALASRTATTVSPTITNYNATGAIFYCRVTAPGTGNLLMQVYGYDAAGGVYFALASSATFSTSKAYALFPGAGAVATGSTDMIGGSDAPLPRTFYVQVVKSDGSAWTFGLGYSLIV
jgi:hypothetical protein